MNNFDRALAFTLEQEGGYSNNPHDPGGATNLGVTQKAWAEFTLQPVTDDDMRSLTVDDVRPFYRLDYWEKIRGDDLPSGVDLAVFDFAVNSGVERAVKALQHVVGAVEDGSLGPRTLKAVFALPAPSVVTGLCLARQKFLQSLPDYKYFGGGWEKRIAALQQYVSLLYV